MRDLVPTTSRAGPNPAAGLPKEEPGEGTENPDLTDAEVRQLWSFHDGAIMCVDVRDHLYRSWGFCPRHTWAYAVCEPEVRRSLHGTAILYEDLTGRAAKALRWRLGGDRLTLRRLKAHDSCFTCDFAAMTGHRDHAANSQRARRVNLRKLFMPLLLQGEALWRRRTCPYCLGGEGLTCRPHLLGGAPLKADLADGLDDIHTRLGRYSRSMRWKSPPPDLEACSSWVEALGWFGGWGYLEQMLAKESSDGLGRKVAL